MVRKKKEMIVKKATTAIMPVMAMIRGLLVSIKKAKETTSIKTAR
jgi:hypothetical protein